MKPLTEVAHEIIRTSIREGMAAIDATVGNGHDTHFLANLVGENGHVYGIDIQEPAITAAKAHLGKLSSRVTWILGDHAHLNLHVESSDPQQIAAIMFNLGYHPGGDKSIVTSPASTCAGISAGINLLIPGGIMTIVCYRGHPGGIEEYQAVQNILQKLSSDTWQLQIIGDSSAHANSPILFAVTRNENKVPD